MSPVVSGQGVLGAAVYNYKEPGPHHVVLLTTSGMAYNDWNEMLPHDWAPSAVSETELVVLIGPEQERSLGMQSYSAAPPIIAYSFEVNMELREARTGLTLTKATFTGTDPRPFPKTAPFDQTRLDGSHFAYAILEDWLCPNVILHGCWMSRRALGGHAEGESPVDFGAGYYLPLTHEEMMHTPGKPPVDFSPDSQTMARVANGSNVQFSRVSDETPLRPVRGNGGTIHSIAFSPDGQSLVIVSTYGGVRVWRVIDGTPLLTLKGYPNNVTNVAFSPDGQSLAFVSDDNLSLYRVSDGALLRTLVVFADGVNDAAFSPDGQTLVIGSRYGNVRLYRVSDGSLLRIMGGQSLTKRVTYLAFSQDGQTLVAASSGSLCVWQVSGGAPLRTLRGQPGPGLVLTLSPDGQILAVWSIDGAVQLWQVR